MNKFLIVMGLSVAILTASTLKVDSPVGMLNNFKYETPKGRVMKIPNKTNLVIAAFEKDTGALVNEYLSSKSPYYLLKNRAIFVADINKMPTIITNMFALPKLQKYKHLIYLHYGEKFQSVVPNKEQMITLIRIEDGSIKNISYISTKEELKAEIEK